jgi:hypothetical protein
MQPFQRYGEHAAERYSLVWAALKDEGDELVRRCVQVGLIVLPLTSLSSFFMTQALPTRDQIEKLPPLHQPCEGAEIPHEA